MNLHIGNYYIIHIIYRIYFNIIIIIMFQQNTLLIVILLINIIIDYIMNIN